MNIALWAIAGLLALAFLGAGSMKLTTPIEKLRERMPWAQDFSAGMVKAIGAAEVLGAIGLILPAAVGVAPVLVPIAALALAAVMAGAVAVHLRRGDGLAGAAPSVVLGLLSLLLAVLRFGPFAF